jgi:hypothetical protein
MFCRYVSLSLKPLMSFRSLIKYPRAFMGFWFNGRDLYPEMSP